jgi:hypothetical protein
MDGYLRQSTAAQVRWIGPFVDDTDFKTAETGLTVANTDIKVSKNGGASASKNSGGGTHDVNGMYAVTWDATDSGTVGELKYSVKVAGALQVFGSYVVLEEAVYDALFAASALGYVANAPVNVAQISGDSAAADALELAYDDTAGAVPSQGITDQGTAQSATATTLVLRAAATFADDTPIGSTLWAFGSDQGYWQSQPILDYVGATDTATVDGWTVTPSGTITYKVFGSAPGSGVAQTGDAYARLGAPAGASVSADIAAVKVDTAAAVDDTNELQTDWANGGRLDLILDARASQASVDTIDDFLDTEMAAVLAAVDTEVAAILAAVDTEVGAIKTQTDKLAFNAANRLLVDLREINDVAVAGDGAATPWGP